jgi:hypothetical protein
MALPAKAARYFVATNDCAALRNGNAENCSLLGFHDTGTNVILEGEDCDRWLLMSPNDRLHRTHSNGERSTG